MIRRPRAALVAALAAALAAGCGASIAPQIHSDSSRLPIARQMYDKGEYSIAVDVLSPYVTTGGGSADIDQAVYLLGLAYLGQHEWVSAQTQFERIGRDYPESDSAAAASYYLGQALWGESRDFDFDQEYTLKAQSQWEAFLRNYPDSPYDTLAETRIAEARTRLARKLWRTGDVYVKLKYYEPAKIYFRDVIDQYGDTPVQGDALLGLAIANARLGHKDSALAVLQGLVHDFAGRPLGLEAARMLAKVKKWPAEGDRSRRGHRPVEPETPPPTPAANPGTSFTP